MTDEPTSRIRLPVLRPRLPSAERLLPYLRTIDDTRIYSNHGPLLLALERRLARQLQIEEGSVTCTSSGTTAIVGSILATAGRATAKAPLALIPAFTFVATAAAVQQCGYEPYLADVAADTWMLDPASLAEHPMLHKVGIVVAVAPFGRPVPQAAWRDFHKTTGIPVVIDGAACFDTILEAPASYLGELPVALSFHATKSFGTGEGGAIVTTDIELALRAQRSLNFGFYGVRDSRSPSTNGKMSEYNAAVGLAELDDWQSKHSALSSVMDLYREASQAVQLAHLLHTYPRVSLCYSLLLCRAASEAQAVQRSLDLNDVDSRQWYGTGVQGHSYFATLPRDRLDVATDILPRLIGLPVALDLVASDIQRVVSAIRPAIAS